MANLDDRALAPLFVHLIEKRLCRGFGGWHPIGTGPLRSVVLFVHELLDHFADGYGPIAFKGFKAPVVACLKQLVELAGALLGNFQILRLKGLLALTASAVTIIRSPVRTTGLFDDGDFAFVVSFNADNDRAQRAELRSKY